MSRGYLDSVIARQQQLSGELAQARGRERAVREQHPPNNTRSFCVGCGLAWPCPTITALDQNRPEVDVDQVADRILTALRRRP